MFKNPVKRISSIIETIYDISPAVTEIVFSSSFYHCWNTIKLFKIETKQGIRYLTVKVSNDCKSLSFWEDKPQNNSTYYSLRGKLLYQVMIRKGDELFLSPINDVKHPTYVDIANSLLEIENILKSHHLVTFSSYQESIKNKFINIFRK